MLIGSKKNIRPSVMIHITDGDHPYMSQWWVPGLQIGYEHSFIHQAADFLAGLASGTMRPVTSASGAEYGGRPWCQPNLSR